jgi:hypothetical protein
MYCNYCGKVIQDDANVCAYCGTRVGAVTARKRLVRPRADRKIAGVCAGFAEYFDLDVVAGGAGGGSASDKSLTTPGETVLSGFVTCPFAVFKSGDAPNYQRRRGHIL